jgi:formylglycine-generating enzyme required for sulfatase activity
VTWPIIASVVAVLTVFAWMSLEIYRERGRRITIYLIVVIGILSICGIGIKYYFPPELQGLSAKGTESQDSTNKPKTFSVKTNGEYQKSNHLFADMAKIDGGSFLYGEKQEEITLPTFYIDKYEVTNNQFVEFLNKYGNRKEKEAYWLDFTNPFSLIKKRKNEFYSKSKMGNKPVVEVTWYGAKAFCKCNGKRLPSEQEWEKAARSTDARKFVWGNNLPSDFKDTNFITNELNNVFNNGDALVDVDNFGKDKSEYEIYNMAGNVSEWTSSWYDEEKTDRVSRGGSWDSKRIDEIHTTYRNGYKPFLSNYAIGFRCAKSP